MKTPTRKDRHNIQPDTELRAAYPELTRLLIQRKTEIIQRENVTRSNLNEQIMTTSGDAADLSVLDTSADYFLELSNSHQRELLEIRSAFDRMYRGIYGICESCKEPIDLERLKKLPYARMCINCQSAAERVTRTPHSRSKPKI